MACNSTCGTHGTCVNDICECEEGWTGRTEFLSFRGHDCVYPVIAQQVAWGVVAFAMLVLSVFHIKAIRYQVSAWQRARDRKAKKGQSYPFWKFPSLQLLLVGLIFTCFGSIALTYLKAVELQAIGADWAISIVFLIVTNSAFYSLSLAEVRNFDLLSGSLDKSGKVRKFLVRALFGTLTIYGLITIIVVCYGCYLQSDYLNSESPHESIMQYMLLVRNASVSFYMIALAKITAKVRDLAIETVHKMTGMKSMETQNASSALEVVEAGCRQKKKSAVVLTVVYIVFSFPPLWPFQTFLIAFFIVLSCLKNHYVFNYTRRRRKGNAVTAETEGSCSSEGFTSNASSFKAARDSFKTSTTNQGN